MNWRHGQMAILDAATSAIGFGVNWLLQSTLLLAVGLAVGRLLKIQGSAVQSVVYRTTLAAVLICPIATWLLAMSGISGWSVEMPKAWTYEQIEMMVADIDPPTTEPSPIVAPLDVGTELPAEPPMLTNEIVEADAPFAAGPPSTPFDTAESSEPPATSSEPTVEESVVTIPAETWLFSIGRFGVAAACLALLWMMFSAGLLWRLATAWRRLARLCGQATRAEPATLRICHELASELAVPTPDVLRSPYLPSPCLARLLQPAVLLPDTELSLSIRDVLVHELAHLARRDCHWNLLRRVATAVFFFQPLMWMLSRRLEATAEEVCDDYVVHFGGDREAYSHRLVDIAELSTAPIAAAGVGIVSLRSMLARRVTRIMDTSRSLSTRVGSLLLTLVLAGGLIGTTTVGLIGVGPQSSVAEVRALSDDQGTPADHDVATEPSETSDVTSDERPEPVRTKGPTSKPDAEFSAVDDRTRYFRYSGQVIDHNGKPVTDALVALVSRLRINTRGGDFSAEEPRILGETATTKDGRFEFRTGPLSSSTHWWVKVMAGAPGHALAWADVNPDAEALTATMVLQPPTRARGRLVTLEGQPAADVELHVTALGQHKLGKLDGVRFNKDGPRPQTWPVGIRTDREGYFEVPNANAETDISFQVDQEPYARQWLFWPASEREGDKAKAFPLPPAHIFDGQVIAEDTGNPLPGARLTLFTHWKSGGGMTGIDGRADDAGRFRLNPFHASAYILSAFAPTGQPYLNLRQTVDWPTGKTTYDARVALPRGILVRGQIVAKDNGQPVTGASVQYWPRSDNPHKRDDIVARWNGNVVTNERGEFAIAVVPGRGNLLVYAPGRNFVFQEIGSSQLYRGKKGGRRYYAHAVVPLDFEPDSDPQAIAVALRRGAVISGKIVGPDGTAPAETRLCSRVHVWPGVPSVQSSPDTIHAGEFRLAGIDPDRTTPVFLLDSKNETGTVLNVSATMAGQALQVQLHPCADCTIRFVDANGDPVVGHEPSLQMVVTPGPSFLANQGKELDELFADEIIPANFDRLHYWDGPFTNADGRVTLKALVPGATYRLFVSRNDEIEVAHEFSVTAGQSLELGDMTITDRDVLDAAADVAAERKPAKNVGRSANDAVGSDVGGEDETPAAKQPSGITPSANGAKKQASAEHATKRIEYTGRVVAPDGKPVVGTSLYWVSYEIGQLPRAAIEPVAKSDADGRFRFMGPRVAAKTEIDQFDLTTTRIVASADGFGLDWISPQQLESGAARSPLEAMPSLLGRGNQTMRLADDGVPVRGRIVNIDGHPIVGANVRVRKVLRPNPAQQYADLASWEKAARQGNIFPKWGSQRPSMDALSGPQISSILPTATTDENGRFELRGIGRERVVELLLAAPGIETTVLRTRTRPGEKIVVKDQSMKETVFYGSEFLHAAPPSVPIEGQVTDIKTGKPLSGVVLYTIKIATDPLHSRWNRTHLTTVTDANGRYRLSGLPIGKDNKVVAVYSGDEPYVWAGHKIDTSGARETARQDFKLTRGVWATGRVFDTATGEPMTGAFDYYVFRTPKVKRTVPGIRDAWLQQFYRTDKKGEFRIPLLAARGILVFRYQGPKGVSAYPRGVGADTIDGARDFSGTGFFLTHPHYCSPSEGHVLVEVDPSPDQDVFNVDIRLSPGKQLTLRVTDVDGKPLSGVEQYGENDWNGWERDKGAVIDVADLLPGKPRKVFFYHRKKDLAGGITVDDTTEDGQVVKLEAAGSIVGRLVDAAGDPITDSKIHPNLEKFATDDEAAIWAVPDFKTAIGSMTAVPVDGEGRFRLEGLVPGLKYSGWANGMRKRNGRMVSEVIGYVLEDVSVQPGEEKDLGDVTLNPPDESTVFSSLAAAFAKSAPEKQKAPTPNHSPEDGGGGLENAPPKEGGELLDNSKPPKLVSPASATVVTNTKHARSNRIHGRVIGADERPVAGAYVAVIAVRMQARRSGDFSPRGEVLAVGRTDEGGDYRLSLEGVSSRSHYFGDVIARKDGMGIAWKRFDLNAPSTGVLLELPPEEPIRGKLVDIEGQPAAGVRLRAHMVMKTTSKSVRSNEWVGCHLPDQIKSPAAWLQAITTDAQGRFTLHGVPVGNGVSLNVIGGDRFAPQDIVLNSGMPEQRDERDATYRSLVKNVAPGEEAVLPLAPAQLFEGVVTHEDTGQPAPHARLTIWASQQEHGSKSGVAGKANEKGRYRISANPGILFRIDAYPPQGAPYQGRNTLHSQAIRWDSGDRVKHVNITLPRGVLVRGKLIEAGSKAPVAGGYVKYSPETSNNPNDVPGFVSGSQVSARDGTFEIAVLPGPGRLLVQDPEGKFFLQQIAGRQLSRGMPGGERYYAHAMKKINPDTDSGPLDVTIELSRGKTIRGRIVDDAGKPIEKALLISRLNIFPGELRWRGDVPQIARDGQFELRGLAPGLEHAVHFLAAQNRLGATARLNAETRNPTVVLQPCGQAVVRFVDKEGQPIAEYHPTMEMVVTPGFLDDFRIARKVGALSADVDFISNIDRTNYPIRAPLKSNQQGIVHLPALIPGATYRIRVSKNGWERTAKTFQGKATETLELGDIVVERRD